MITAADIRQVRLELTRAGVFEKNEARTFGKLVFLLTVAFSLIAVHTVLPLWGTVLLLPVTALFLSAAAMIGHEGGHRSFSSNGLRSELLYHFVFPFMGGLGAIQWKDKHNVRHHGHPNVVGVDDDMELWPLAHTREEHLRAGPIRRFVQRHAQGWLWWPMTMLFTWSIKVDSIGALVRHAKKHGITRAWVFDATAQILHYVAWLVLPSLAFGFLPVFGFYLALFGLLSLFLALVFTTGHMGLPIREAGEGALDGWALQLDTTRNLILPKWLSFFFVGLDFQIEHHLFPKIPHANLPRAAPIVQRWIEGLGLTYHRVPYGKALVDVTRYVANAWDIPAVPVPAPKASLAA